ncbi:MAG: aryl-sulfate sulfotransferase [Candidatus Hodarchaeota archaeon]
MYKIKMFVLFLLLCFQLNDSFPDHTLLESELPVVDRSHGESLIQTDASAPYLGNTLTHTILSGPQGKAISKLLELDPAGNIIWNFTYFPNGRPGLIFDSELLPNGNILFVGNVGEDLPQFWGYNLHSQIIEMTRAGEIIWKYDLYWRAFKDHEIHDVDKLDNGNILIADTSRDRVIEVTRDYQVVWEWRAIDWFDPPANWDPYADMTENTTNDWTHLNDADRLPNGHTLISLRNLRKVIEVNETGHIVWSWGNKTVLWEPHNPDKLLNGNVLICDSGANRIIEVNTTTKEIVWQYEGMLNWPRDADRLPNGNTLIADSNNNRIIEITLDGEIVWERTGLTRVYEADRLNTVPPTLSIDSPRNQTYNTTYPIEVGLSSPDWDLNTLWFRIHDDTNDAWVNPANVTWDGVVQRELPPGNYTLFAYVNDTTDWWQGDDVHLSLTTTTSVSFSVVEHDVAVRRIGIGNMWSPTVQVERGQQVSVHVNVTNQGSVEERVRVNLMVIMGDPDSMKVTTSLRNTSISSQIVTVAAGTSQIITFEWNTSETPAGTNELVATVDAVPEDVDTADNFASIMVRITSPPMVCEFGKITFNRNVLCIGIILFFTCGRIYVFKNRRTDQSKSRNAMLY